MYLNIHFLGGELAGGWPVQVPEGALLGFQLTNQNTQGIASNQNAGSVSQSENPGIWTSKPIEWVSSGPEPRNFTHLRSPDENTKVSIVTKQKEGVNQSEDDDVFIK
jgi:hypothetical protein